MNMKKRIKELREDLALSQEKFGNLVGVTRSHIASMENGVCDEMKANESGAEFLNRILCRTK